MILITGATGYIGSHLVQRLVAMNERPRCLVRRASAIGGLPASAVDVVYGDITDPGSLRAALTGVDRVVHLAAVTANIKETAQVSYHKINVQGTRNLIEAARAAGVARVVMLSGIGAQPGAEGSWIRTRWEGEEVVRHGGVPYTIIQPSVLFGGKRAEFFAAQARVLRQSPVAPNLGNGRFKFQPIWVEDVCTCILKALDDPVLTDTTVAVGGPEIFTYEGLLDLIMDTMGKRKPKVRAPLGLMRLNAAVAQALLPRPPITTATIDLFNLGDNITDLDAVAKHFGFQPRSLRDDLRENGV